MRLKRCVAHEGARWHIMTSIQLFKPLLKKRNNSITQIFGSVNSFSNIFLKNMNIFLRSGYTILFCKKHPSPVQARHVRPHAPAVRSLCLLRAQIRRAGQSPHAAFCAVTWRRTKGGRVSRLPLCGEIIVVEAP